jgi:hypothetical protein
MPVQHTLFGHPLRLHMPPRRFQLLAIVVVLFVLALTTYGPRSSAGLPTYSDVASAVKNPHLPDAIKSPHLPDAIKNPLPALPPNPFFGPATHSAPKPLVQPNSTVASPYSPIAWFSDFKWRNPFSESLTFDENTSLLPPLPRRPSIFTYYDVPPKQDKAVTEAEHRLILAWRRAWWAQGFKPQVLSRAEAMQHPQYHLFQRIKLDAPVEAEVLRWLAWGHMGGGLLTSWLALPMAEYENPTLAFLRRHEYPTLSRFGSLNHAVFFGQPAAVDDAINKAMNNPLLRNTTANKSKITDLAGKQGGAVVNLLPSGHVATDSKADGIAYYSLDVLGSSYKTILDKLTGDTKADGLDLLANLINSHLHLTFQAQHPEGLAVVKPLPEHTTALISEAIDIGRNLTQCPTSPMPESCPPNHSKCTPCSIKHPVKMQLVPEFVNTTKLFTIGTVPHPYTTNSLHYTRDNLDVTFLRKKANRNLWLSALTQKSIGKDHSETYRLLQFKDLVAAIPLHTLWLTAERVTQEDIDWIFGFKLPQNASATKEPTSPSEKSEVRVFPRPGFPEPIKGVNAPEDGWIDKEGERLKKAREAIKSKDRFMRGIVDAVEKWNLADTEAWRFSRAYSARRREERKKWEKEEHRFAGSEQNAGVRAGGSGGGGRWTDRL